MKSTIIVAGGSGQRMNTSTPKQFLLIQGLPILMHTIHAFHSYDPTMPIIVVLPEAEIDHWKHLCHTYQFNIPHTVTCGGPNRFQSVKNGLSKVPSQCTLVAIHDGVRPLVSHDTIAHCFDTAATEGTAIPVIDLVDSIRKVTAQASEHKDRNLYKIVQTPQVFNTKLLQNAYCQPYSALFTDDASVVENTGTHICMTQGNRENIKITTQTDLIIAEALLSKH